MQKTKLGISVGLMGAAMYFVCFFSGSLAAIILAGYILLFEDNAWLKRTAVKANVLMFAFLVLSALIGFIPNLTGLINDLLAIFETDADLSIITKITGFIDTVIVIAEKALFLFLGIKALTQGSVNIPVIDPAVNKHIS